MVSSTSLSCFPDFRLKFYFTLSGFATLALFLCPFSRYTLACMCVCKVTSVMCNSLQPYGLETHQAPLSMGFSTQDYWSGLPWPFLGYLLDPRIEPPSLMSPALAGRFFSTGITWEVLIVLHILFKKLINLS